MLSALFLFLRTKTGRYAVGIVVLLMVGAGVVAHYHAKWQQEEADKIAAQQLDQQKKDLELKNKQAEDKIAQQQTILENAQQAQQQAMQLAQSAQNAMNLISNQLSVLATKRQTDLAAVSSMTDQQRALDVQTKLGVRHPGDPTPYGFTAAEVLNIDKLVTDYPNAMANVTLLQQKMDEAQKQVNALEQRVAADGAAQEAIKTQRDLAIQSWKDAMAAYVQASNEFPRQRSFGQKVCHVVTFGLGCKKKQWNLKEPQELLKEAPLAKTGG